MKIFLTGASGFIGKKLTEKLVRRGHIVTVLTRSKNKSNFLKVEVKKVIHGNILNPKKYTKELVKNDAVIHLAAIRANWGNKKDFLKVNGYSVSNLFVKGSRVKHVILTSSVYVHGPLKKIPANESHPVNTRDIYSKSKVLAERLTKKYSKRTNIPYTIIRPAIVYGVGDNETGFVSKMVSLLKKNKFLFIGDGENYVHLVYFDDLVDAYIKALEKGGNNKVFIIASKNAIKLKELVKIIQHELK